MVKNILTLLQPFSFLNGLPVKPPVQSLIAMILEYGIIKLSSHSRLLGCAGKLCVMFCHLPAQHKTLFLILCQRSVFIKHYLCTASLKREICLCLSYNSFGCICILHGKVTGIPAHFDVINLALSAFPQ